MEKLRPEDLEKIKAKVTREHTLTREGVPVEITLHLGTCGIAAGGEEVLKALYEEIERSEREDIRVIVAGCFGLCSSETNMVVRRFGEEAVLYGDLTADKTREVFQGHVLRGEIQKAYAMARLR